MRDQSGGPNSSLTLQRVHALEYASVPSHRSTRRHRTIVIRVHGLIDGDQFMGVGECPLPTSGPTDAEETIWRFLSAFGSNVADDTVTLNITTRDTSLGSILSVLEVYPNEYESTTAEKRIKFALETALLDLIGRVKGIPATAILASDSTSRSIPLAPRPIAISNKNPRKLKPSAPVWRINADHNVAETLSLVQKLSSTLLELETAPPLLIHGNESFSWEASRELVEELIKGMKEKEFAQHVILEQPLSRDESCGLAKLQELTLHQGGFRGGPYSKLRIMPDARVTPLTELRRLIADRGCKAISVHPAVMGGSIPARNLIREALESDPDTWVLASAAGARTPVAGAAMNHAAMGMPRLDAYISHRPRQARTENPGDAPGIGKDFNYEAAFSSITRHGWWPALPAPLVEGRTVNRYESERALRRGSTSKVESQLLSEYALGFGMNVTRYTRAVFVATHPSGSSMPFRLSGSITAGQAGLEVTRDKGAARTLMLRSGVPAPTGRTFANGEHGAASDYADSLGYPVVVKPLKGRLGESVFTGLASRDQVIEALKLVDDSRFGDSEYIVEEHILGDTYRVFVAGDKVTGFVRYEHGTVTGNGQLTIIELLLQKQELRWGNPHLRSRPIMITEAMKFKLRSGGLALDTVLPKDERITFTTNPNFKQGGESIDVLDEVHPTILDAAVRAVAAIPNLTFAGVDFIIPDHRTPLERQRAAVCELNSQATLGSALFPLYGKPRDVAKDLLQHVSDHEGLCIPTKPSPALSVRITVGGRVQGVGFRAWMSRKAERGDLSGWVQNKRDGSVEAVLNGSREAVAAVVADAIDGPRSAKPEFVRVEHTSEQPDGGFQILSAGSSQAPAKPRRSARPGGGLNERWLRRLHAAAVARGVRTSRLAESFLFIGNSTPSINVNHRIFGDSPRVIRSLLEAPGVREVFERCEVDYHPDGPLKSQVLVHRRKALASTDSGSLNDIAIRVMDAIPGCESGTVEFTEEGDGTNGQPAIRRVKPELELDAFEKIRDGWADELADAIIARECRRVGESISTRSDWLKASITIHGVDADGRGEAARGHANGDGTVDEMLRPVAEEASVSLISLATVSSGKLCTVAEGTPFGLAELGARFSLHKLFEAIPTSVDIEPLD